MTDLTTLLAGVRRGNADSLKELLAFLYEDLRGLARSRLKRSQRITMLDTTALVHESYLRLVRSGRLELQSRGHFFAYAATTMRSIIVDHIRERQSLRRGGSLQHVTLDANVESADFAAEAEIVRVNDALAELDEVDPRLVKIVELRYFAGMAMDEIASVLSLNERTVRREWQKARIMLRAALE